MRAFSHDSHEWRNRSGGIRLKDMLLDVGHREKDAAAMATELRHKQRIHDEHAMVRILDGLDVWNPHHPVASEAKVQATIAVTGNTFGRTVDAVLESQFSNPDIADLRRNAYRP